MIIDCTRVYKAGRTANALPVCLRIHPPRVSRESTEPACNGLSVRREFLHQELAGTGAREAVVSRSWYEIQPHPHLRDDTFIIILVSPLQNLTPPHRIPPTRAAASVSLLRLLLLLLPHLLLLLLLLLLRRRRLLLLLLLLLLLTRPHLVLLKRPKQERKLPATKGLPNVLGLPTPLPSCRPWSFTSKTALTLTRSPGTRLPRQLESTAQKCR